MTVKEYREKNPNCKYCRHGLDYDYVCEATGKFCGFFQRIVASTCPLYEPKPYYK